MSGEVPLPQARDEFGNPCGRMLTDTLEDVDQISVGVDDVQPASHNQALRNTHVFSTELGPTKKP